MSFSIRALLAPFLQQDDGDADSLPEEDQHEDDKCFNNAEYYHFKQEKKNQHVIQINPKDRQTFTANVRMNLMVIFAKSDETL